MTDTEWRHRWHTRLGRTETETEGQFYERLECHIKMLSMPVEWRYRWCAGSGPCACLGAANCSGGLGGAPEAKAQWEMWVAEHPYPFENDLMLKPLNPGRLPV